MNEHITTIENLLRAKKKNNKKEPAKAEKDDFRNAWIALVSEEGYPGEAEQFLYEGFSFCGMEPFYMYMKHAANQDDILRQLFEGEHYGKDCNVTFKIIVHLFALMLNDEVPANLLVSIIKRFPSACLNKEGKRLGTAAKTMEKYFLKVLSPSIAFCPFGDMDVDPDVIKRFLATFSSLINELKQAEGIKEPAIANILHVENWAKDYLGIKDQDNHQLIDRSNSEISTDPVDETAVESLKKGIDMNSLQDILTQAQILASRLEKENGSQKQQITDLEIKEHDNGKRIEEISKELESEKKVIVELRKQIFELESQCRSLQHDLDGKEKLLLEKDAEIADRIKMSEVLSRDRSRQADESLQRIASKIRVEYRDFKDAIDAPMSDDLGENLRFQLLSVFEILEKGGMKIE